MSEVIIKLDNITEEMFFRWLNSYVHHKRGENKKYPYKVHSFFLLNWYDPPSNRNEYKLNALLCRVVKFPNGEENTIREDVPDVLRLEWLKYDKKLKLTFRSHNEFWAKSILDEFVKDVREDWQDVLIKAMPFDIGAGKRGIPKRKESKGQDSGRLELSLQKVDAEKSDLVKELSVSKSKRGQSRYSNEEKLKALLDWDKIDSGVTTLSEFLDNKFGNTIGSLNVPESTFHGWRRRLKELGLYIDDTS